MVNFIQTAKIPTSNILILGLRSHGCLYRIAHSAGAEQLGLSCTNRPAVTATSRMFVSDWRPLAFSAAARALPCRVSKSFLLRLGVWSPSMRSYLGGGLLGLRCRFAPTLCFPGVARILPCHVPTSFLLRVIVCSPAETVSE